MVTLLRSRRFAFGIFLVAASMFSTVQSSQQQPLYCPYYQCTSCPADWMGPCYTTSSSCATFECNETGGTCTIEGGGSESYNLCVCPPCM
jgi:hypothetical protein